ncbi:MAG: nucleotidyltransferase domain-containing protein [Deltaproteobacteria bacterium]|nr:nucleotidyltransferase domain-containing protein [Deltaproteobacteria bacterium]
MTANVREPYGKLLDDFVAALKKSFGDNLVSVVLYGSVARGEARKDSDIDVCLVFRSLPKCRHERTKLIHPILLDLRERESYLSLYRERYLPEIAPISYTAGEIEDTKPIFLDMVEDAILLLDDGTFSAKLHGLRKRMAELGTRKVALDDGSHYWVLKPGMRLGEEVVI